MAEVSSDLTDTTDLLVAGVARVYARALIDASGDQLDTVLGELNEFLEEVVPRSPHLEAVMSSGLVSPDLKVQMIDRVFRGRSSPLFISFLKVVAERGRGQCLRSIGRAVRAILAQRQGRVAVGVTTAAPLSSEATGQLAERLQQLIQAQPVIQSTVDPRLIGGVVLKIGDTVYDGSVSTRLEKLRTQLLQRSVHEV